MQNKNKNHQAESAVVKLTSRSYSNNYMWECDYYELISL